MLIRRFFTTQSLPSAFPSAVAPIAQIFELRDGNPVAADTASGSPSPVREAMINGGRLGQPAAAVAACPSPYVPRLSFSQRIARELSESAMPHDEDWRLTSPPPRGRAEERVRPSFPRFRYRGGQEGWERLVRHACRRAARQALCCRTESGTVLVLCAVCAWPFRSRTSLRVP